MEVKVKNKGGRPLGSTPGHKVGNALEATKTAMDNITDLVEKMSDRQRRAYSALATGMDPLEACLVSGIEDFGIVKIVYDKNHKPVEIANVTIDNVHDLDAASYQRLLNIANAIVKDLLNKGQSVEEYFVDVRKLLKIVAPEAFKSIADIAQFGAKDADRLNAAKDILDRSGYTAETAPKKDAPMPVMIQINFDKKPVSEIKPEVKYVEG